MNPRKSSTSSGRARTTRARYLGVEVVAQPLPSSSLPGWEGLLRTALERFGGPSVRFRVIRSDRRRAIVEVSHADLARARSRLGRDRGERLRRRPGHTSYVGDPSRGEGLDEDRRRDRPARSAGPSPHTLEIETVASDSVNVWGETTRVTVPNGPPNA